MSIPSTLPPSKQALADQATDRKDIKRATATALTNQAVVGAQIGIVETEAGKKFVLPELPPYLQGRSDTVGKEGIHNVTCVAAHAVFESIKAIEKAKTPESPLVEGARCTVDCGSKGVAAVVGAKAATDARAAAVKPSVTDCKKPE